MSDSEFKYTYIPVKPDSKSPALAKGFSYDQFSYGGDCRNGDLRQAGHVTHPNALLFVIDVDDIAGFLDSELGKLLVSTGRFEDFITYKSVTAPKFHLYFTDPERNLDEDEWPGQWASEYCYDVKSNGFVRAEPAYMPTGNEPTDFGNMPARFVVDFLEAIKTDKQAYFSRVRKTRPEKQGDYLPGSFDLLWDDWHNPDGTPVKDFTCDYQDALRLAGQLRNYYEGYDDALREFLTAIYVSPVYDKDETWEQTFERMWHSMEPNGGMSIEERQRRETEMLDRIDPTGEGREYAVNKAQERFEYSQAYNTPFQSYEYEPPEEEDEGFGSAYFPGPEAPAARMPQEAQAVARHLQPGTPEYVETQRHFAREKAKELWTENKRQQEEAKWTGFSNPLKAPPVPEPSMFKIRGSDLNAQTSLIIPNKVTVIYGSRGGGKTWTSAVWAAQHVNPAQSGGSRHVMWLDFERQEQLMGKKLKVLGVKENVADDFFHYSGGGLPPVGKLVAHLQEWDGALIVIDSWQDLMGAVVPGADSNKAEAVNEVYEKFINPLITAGASICIIAHPSKTGGAPGAQGSVRGSERAESAADYVIQLEQKIPFTEKQSGFAILKVTKDRYGLTPNGEVVGALWVGGRDGKIGPGVSDYPEVPDIRCWAPDSEAKAEQKLMSNDIDQRQKFDLIDYLRDEGAHKGLVELSQPTVVKVLLQRDKMKPAEERAWIAKAAGKGTKAGDALGPDAVKKILAALSKGENPVFFKRPTTKGKDIFSWELGPEHKITPIPGDELKTQAEKPSIEGFEDSEESSPPWE